MELNQTSICCYDRRLARISTCTESADTIVPDSLPDVGRVVCAFGSAAVRDQTPQSGRLLVSGVVQTTVLYEPEQGGGLRRLQVPVSFAHIEECDGLDAEAVCAVCCRVASVEATAVNSRKLNVRVQLCMDLTCYGKTECEVTEGVSLPELELRSELQTVTLIEQACAYPLTVLDDVTIEQEDGAALLHAGCSLRATECRAMHGKAVVKGEADIRCLALQEDGAVRVLSSQTPFTQIWDLPDAEDGDAVDAQLAVREVDCRLEEGGLLSYTVSAGAVLTLRRPRALRRIDDLYVPGRTLQLQQEETVLHSLPPLAPFGAEASENLPTAQHVSHVVWADGVCCGARRGEADALQLTAAVQVLYLDDDQRLCAVQRMLPLSMPCAAEGEVCRLALAVRAAPAGESGLLATVTAAGMASPETRYAFRHILSAAAEGEPQDRGGVTLLLRYVGAEEPLWEMAKRCGTTVAAIRQANALPDETESVSGTMLLIPLRA